jgi:hypothetical protein
MADYQMKNGQGSAFPKNKTKDTQPDFQGELLTPSGEKLEISMWKKPMRNGGEFFSISVKPPFVASQPQKTQEDMPDFLQ